VKKPIIGAQPFEAFKSVIDPLLSPATTGAAQRASKTVADDGKDNLAKANGAAIQAAVKTLGSQSK
jgi:hypothetical protein